MSAKTRTTAARLDQFKKPDGWAQRRVEEGFAANAIASANCRSFMAGEAAPLGREMPEPLNLSPFYWAVAALAALAIIDGCLAHWGFSLIQIIRS